MDKAALLVGEKDEGADTVPLVVNSVTHETIE